jgi:hypothetical protein
MSSASINDLPDSAFAYIEPGGKKDSSGKTTPRSLRHFPIHDEAHVRNALSRAPQSPFGDKAMPAIRRAAKKFGIQVSDVKAAAGVDLLGVELARPGPWKVASGDGNFTAEMLRDAADFFTASGGQAVPIKLGHVDDRWDGEPAFGSVTNVRYIEDDRGPVLLGDLRDMPGWLSAAAPRSWPNRSIEGWQDFTYEGREYSLILSGLAFLGVTPPAVRNIRSLADLQTALAASSAQRVLASAPPDDPAEPPPEPPEPAPEAPAAEAPGLLAAQPEAPAVTAEESTESPTREGAIGMPDAAKLREALGLNADASDDEVKAALVAAGLAPQDAPPEPEPVAAGSAQELDKRIAAAAAKGGLVTIDPAQLQEFRDAMVRASALTKRLETQDRDNTITEAIKAGRFPPARRQHYERAWDIDPVGTKELIASIATGLVPVTASGYATDADREDDELDREIARLSDPSHRKVA